MTNGLGRKNLDKRKMCNKVEKISFLKIKKLALSIVWLVAVGRLKK
jgi:hypothetical protein